MQDLIHELQYLQSSQEHFCCKYGVIGVHCILNFGRKHVEYMIIYIKCMGRMTQPPFCCPLSTFFFCLFLFTNRLYWRIWNCWWSPFW